MIRLVVVRVVSSVYSCFEDALGRTLCICVFFFFFFKQKTAYEMIWWLEFRRVLFRSHILLWMTAGRGPVLSVSLSRKTGPDESSLPLLLVLCWVSKAAAPARGLRYTWKKLSTSSQLGLKLESCMSIWNTGYARTMIWPLCLSVSWLARFSCRIVGINAGRSCVGWLVSVQISLLAACALKSPAGWHCVLQPFCVLFLVCNLGQFAPTC